MAQSKYFTHKMTSFENIEDFWTQNLKTQENGGRLIRLLPHSEAPSEQISQIPRRITFLHRLNRLEGSNLVIETVKNQRVSEISPDSNIPLEKSNN